MCLADSLSPLSQKSPTLDQGEVNKSMMLGFSNVLRRCIRTVLKFRVWAVSHGTVVDQEFSRANRKKRLKAKLWAKLSVYVCVLFSQGYRNGVGEIYFCVCGSDPAHKTKHFPFG